MQTLPTTEEIYSNAAAEGARPDPLLSVSEWADTYRSLSQRASAEPGPWRTDRTPYLREIMDCLSPSSPIETVVLMKGAQVGGTECGNNWIGYVVHQAPGPMLQSSLLWKWPSATRNSASIRLLRKVRCSENW